MALQVYHSLKSVIKDKYGQDACNVGDEGGFAPNIQSNLEGIELLMAAIKKAGYEDKVILLFCFAGAGGGRGVGIFDIFRVTNFAFSIFRFFVCCKLFFSVVSVFFSPYFGVSFFSFFAFLPFSLVGGSSLSCTKTYRVRGGREARKADETKSSSAWCGRDETGPAVVHGEPKLSACF